MSEDESGSENSINKDLNEEKPQENVDEDDNSDINEKKTRSAPKRSPAKSPKSRASHPIRNSPTFDSQMSQEQAELNLIKLFGNAFLDAAKDSLLLSDKLSVRDLRIIVRVLRLCGATEANVRKPILCDYLMKHMQKPHMINMFTEYSEEKEKNRAARMKNREEKNKNSSAEQTETKKSNRSSIRFSTTSTRSSSRKDGSSHSSTAPPSPRRHSSSENLPLSSVLSSPSSVSTDNGNNTNLQLSGTGSGRIPMPIQVQQNRNVNEVSVPRLKLDSTFDLRQSLDILQKCNSFVLDVSNKLTELERSLSIMAFKINELEKFYE